MGRVVVGVVAVRVVVVAAVDVIVVVVAFGNAVLEGGREEAND